jgi:hypothetical protein
MTARNASQGSSGSNVQVLLRPRRAHSGKAVIASGISPLLIAPVGSAKIKKNLDFSCEFDINNTVGFSQ